MVTFWNRICDGLKFQIKYTIYSLKRWPVIIVLYLICICVLGILEPFEVYFQKEIVSAVTNNTDLAGVSVVVALYLLVSVLFLFQGYASPIVQRIIGLKVASWIEGKTYRAIQSVPLEYLDSADSQVKFDRANDATTHISSGPALLMYSISYIVSLVIPTIQLIRYPLLLSIYYAMGFILAIHNTYQSQKADQLRKSLEVDKRALRYFSKLLENKNTMIETRVHGYNKYFYSQWENLTETFFQKQMQLKKKQVKESLGISVLQQFIGIAPIGILYFLIADRTIDIASYTLVTGMGAIVTRYIGYLFNAFSKSSSCGIYTEDMEEVLTFEPPKLERINASCGNSIVDMRCVSFHYVEGKTVLDNIDFQVLENEIVAIVGENGSGKTTLSHLALGLYKPKKGSVAVCGQDISNQEIDLQGIISPVFQDFTKYEFTVRENVGYGSITDIDDDEKILSAISSGGFQGIYDARLMSLETFLGKQYETSGEDLSGGEWQRVAISRGFLANAKLIVLDEPTASLDPLSEIRLFDYIKSNLKKRAAIIVSHRIGICKLADRIIFMKGGRISESGTHEELYATHGDYYKFFNEQAKWYDWRRDREESKT